MDRPHRFIPYIAFAAAGAAGAALALVGAYAVRGSFDGTSTVTVREVSVENTAEPTRFRAPGSVLTIGEIYKRSAPGVVQITATGSTQVDPFGGSESQRALGSGFVFDKAGYIITNYHVVQGAGSIEVTFSNNASINARLVGSDPSRRFLSVTPTPSRSETRSWPSVTRSASAGRRRRGLSVRSSGRSPPRASTRSIS